VAAQWDWGWSLEYQQSLQSPWCHQRTVWGFYKVWFLILILSLWCVLMYGSWSVPSMRCTGVEDYFAWQFRASQSVNLMKLYWIFQFICQILWSNSPRNFSNLTLLLKNEIKIGEKNTFENFFVGEISHEFFWSTFFFVIWAWQDNSLFIFQALMTQSFWTLELSERNSDIFWTFSRKEIQSYFWEKYQIFFVVERSSKMSKSRKQAGKPEIESSNPIILISIWSLR